MASEEEKTTIHVVASLDRQAIESALMEVRRQAQSANLRDLADMFNGVEGMPRALIERNVGNALKWLADKPHLDRLASQLELVGLNLPNLK